MEIFPKDKFQTERMFLSRKEILNLSKMFQVEESQESKKSKPSGWILVFTRLSFPLFALPHQVYLSHTTCDLIS